MRFDQRCILSKFYIKPQPSPRSTAMLPRCILSKFYIKPQHRFNFRCSRSVVSYRNSTSNHNYRPNYWRSWSLYLIEILHQTTTIVCTMRFDQRCILSKFYIKPQPSPRSTAMLPRCILSKFYIKPQPVAKGVAFPFSCILSKFYIKPQQAGLSIHRAQSCILSKFYIKPQRLSRFYEWR